MTDSAVAPSMNLAFFKINVADLDTATRFYTDCFGFTVVDQISLPTVAERMLRQPDATFTLVLLRWMDGRAIAIGNGFGPVGFLTRDVDAAYASALRHGAAALRPPSDMGTMRVAFVLDPEGHEIELLQYGRVA